MEPVAKAEALGLLEKLGPQEAAEQVALVVLQVTQVTRVLPEPACFRSSQFSIVRWPAEYEKLKWIGVTIVTQQIVVSELIGYHRNRLAAITA